MLIHLRKQATTTPKVRAAIQASDEVGTILAERSGVTSQTIYKWRKRDSGEDRSHTPHRMQKTLTPAQEAVAVALRKTLLVSLDDLLAVVREFLTRMSHARGWIAACIGMAWVICATCSPRAVNGGDKAGHSAAQIPAIGRAPSGMTRALTRSLARVMALWPGGPIRQGRDQTLTSARRARLCPSRQLSPFISMMWR